LMPFAFGIDQSGARWSVAATGTPGPPRRLAESDYELDIATEPSNRSIPRRRYAAG
jgi:hypothetical protein